MKSNLQIEETKAQPRWMIYTKRADFDLLSERFGISPITARIIRNRDVTDEREMERYLYGTLHDLPSPHKLKNADYAAGLLQEKIAQGARIRIVGDYDIDGICSTYILYCGLKRCGANVDYQIPERIRDGYGINENIIREAASDGIDTIITCDNGISAASQIALARQHGMTVIVTDHHEVPLGPDGNELLPPANVIVNPKQAADHSSFKDICGGVVAWKLVGILYEFCGIPESEWTSMLDFAAIATVGDVMPLRGENRLIVKWGLKQIPQTRSRGLLALIDACGLDLYALTAYHIGFVIGPCLNASGRLQTARLALEMLLSTDDDKANQLAAKLQELNEERKFLTQKGVADAMAQAEKNYAGDAVLVIFLPDCHESIAGIIAGRIREAWNRPTLVLTRAEDCVKGSGRSIPAYHMFRKLNEVSDLLLKFGGHPMAAGFSLPEKDIDEFRRRLNEQAGLTPDDFIPEIWIDVPMPVDCLSESLINELSLLEPFGQGNEKPQFAQKALRIRSARVFGKRRNAVRLSLLSVFGTPIDALIFTDGDRFMEELGNCRTIDAVYYPEIDEYNGKRTIQIIIKEYKLRP